MLGFKTNLLRKRVEGEDAKVDFVELFFDLVFVFAIAQTSHLLLENLNPLGYLQTGLMLSGIWWIWIYTAWVTNWLDPRHPAVRAMLFALMLVGLVLTSSIPQAFGERGLVFALCYAAMQCGRTAFTVLAFRHQDQTHYRNFLRILAWQVFFSIFWIAGGLQEGDLRLVLWAIAIAIEFLAALVAFWIPWLGSSSTTQWTVDGHHMAERCGLFIIIMLGESLLITGTTFTKLVWDPSVVAAFVTAVVGAVTMWWIYFAHGAEHAAENIAHSDNPGRKARLIYTYQHILVVAGIILVAVANEIVLAHPVDHQVTPVEAAAILGGPFLFLAGNAMITYTTRNTIPTMRLLGLAVLVALFPLAKRFDPLPLGIIATVVLIVGTITEAVNYRPKPKAQA